MSDTTKHCSSIDERIQKRSVGGRPAERHEYPWTLVLEGPTQCSAVLISSHHVLTAAHCGADRDYDVPCTGTETNKPYITIGNEKMSIIVATEDSCSLENIGSCTSYGIKTLTIHPDYNPCNGRHDLAVLEITSDISSDKSTPICMPKKDEDIPTRKHGMTAVGFGHNPDHPGVRRMDAVNVTMDGTYADRSLIVTKNDGKSICLKLTWMPSTVLSFLGMQSFFEDVRDSIDWVCEVTGVCPKRNL
ncbi:trypsin [Dictyocaulus viviparus]|uniref:Trypsin n=1 Tax=Dictyocaulus viviparus TaxID=29172 RepID=A0A0D8XRE1_DICVI|nr:trypsin [Dictyocaulus viviparus]